MKHILGLDLGNTSIGWAYVQEANNDSETSDIINSGVRIVPLVDNERKNFLAGKAITTTADRTLKRGIRRNLSRYKLRREALISILRKAGLITDDTILGEQGKGTTYETLRLRAKAAHKQISLEELARVLLAINKKRGYKSNRKMRDIDEGEVLDALALTKEMYDNGHTPGQYAFDLLTKGRRHLPTFYRSDLMDEYEKIWKTQSRYYPEMMTTELLELTQGIPKTKTTAILCQAFGIDLTKRTGSRDDIKRENYSYRSRGVTERLLPSELIIALQEINGEINSSSSYLAGISDRSKELYFDHKTVGEYYYDIVTKDRHASLTNLSFFRKDYLDEFETIWETQRQYYPEVLTTDLKSEIRDTIIFYQRKLKSQKHLVAYCELAKQQVKLDNGSTRTIGPKVAPKSSPIFQEVKIWMNLANVRIAVRARGAVAGELPPEDKAFLFEELNTKGSLTGSEVLRLLYGSEAKKYKINYDKLEGNSTSESIINSLLLILAEAGYDLGQVLDGKPNWEREAWVNKAKLPATEVLNNVETLLKELGIDPAILHFDATLEGAAFMKQPSYRLWHLLYSYEADDSPSGNEHLYRALQRTFGFDSGKTGEHRQAEIMAQTTLASDYGHLSTKALRKIYPFLPDYDYSEACEKAGYNHSRASITKEENDARILSDRLDILPKNSLRQPVVEKVLNQMIHVVNALMDQYSTDKERFHFDEIRIELARELKQNVYERAETTKAIKKGTDENDRVRKILMTDPVFNISRPTRKDIVRYRLWEELASIGYKDIYTGREIPKEYIFTNKVNVDHIIPQARVFDDSFSNKVLTFTDFNIRKGNRTAYDYISSLGQAQLEDFESRVKLLVKDGKISQAKKKKLLRPLSDLGDGFIERDLRESQYISREAMHILLAVTHHVVPTTGKITSRLREDWGLMQMIKELNLPKYRELGRVEKSELRDGRTITDISDWSKREDHRHHAMDAITIAFTKQAYVNYFNHLSALTDEQSEYHSIVRSVREKSMIRDNEGKYIFKEPFPHFRMRAKESLSAILVSHKAKNKVVTSNINKIETKGKGTIVQSCLTPRGMLHKESMYGLRLVPMDKEMKLDKKMTHDQARMIIDRGLRAAVLARLEKYGDDAGVAFSTKTKQKDPFLYKEHEITSVLCYTPIFTIRKPVDASLKASDIPKVLDGKVRQVLTKRLKDYGGDPKKAFSDLEENPIWLNREEGITIKRVTLKAKTTSATPIHDAHDHLGQTIVEAGITHRKDFVDTGNNHHVALYIDKKGKVQESIVSFMEAVERVLHHQPIVQKILPEHPDWTFLFSLKKDEMFVFADPEHDFDPTKIDLTDPSNKTRISPHLYRIQKLTSGDYTFRHHLETTINNDVPDVTYKRITDKKKMLSAVKVRTDHLGNIVSVGEY